MSAPRLSLAISLLLLCAGCDKKKDAADDGPPPPQTVTLGGDDADLADLTVEVPAVAGTATVSPMGAGKVALTATNLHVEIVVADEIDESFKTSSGREVRVDKDTADEFLLTFLPRSEGEGESYNYFVKKEVDGKGYVCGARLVSEHGKGLAQSICASLAKK